MRNGKPVAPLFIRRAASLTIICAALGAAGCTSTGEQAVASSAGSKEYFSEAEYGVKASPRVAVRKSRLPRGGGREQIGKPYKVKGKWYYPREDAGYAKVGAASWYGDAFHGRLTANGEVYDMTHLTAAHPTMPLPSYARVTNTANGHSVVVRVNDRGPFARGRIIDLSKRAAEMLDYTQAGVAKVHVEYLGRAPLHGQDDQYLMASFRPGTRGPAIEDEVSPGVMIAMNGPTPVTRASATAAAFPGDMRTQPGDPLLPEAGPIAPERPLIDMLIETAHAATPPALSYAVQQENPASRALAELASGGMTDADVVAARELLNAGQDYIAVGSFADRMHAKRLVEELSAYGRAEMETDASQGTPLHVVSLYGDGRHPLDTLLRQAWAHGAGEAIPVRQ